MNTTPKAKRFRVRRSLTLEQREAALKTSDGQAPRPPFPAPSPNPAPKSAPMPGPTSAPPATAARPAATPSPPAPAETPTTELTGRQMRLARRLAERRGLAVNSDEEALAALRARGIDPFRPNAFAAVSPETPPASRAATPQTAAPSKAAVPQPVPLAAQASRVAPDDDVDRAPRAQVPAQIPVPKPPAAPAPVSVPSPNDAAKARHAAEIMAMQKQIAQRRRMRLISLGVRLVAFVLLPTLLAGYYFAAVATPMYSTHSSFYVQKSAPSMPSGAGNLLSGTSLANSQDSISVQNFLLSRDAMLRLDADTGFRAAFQDPSVDALQRLDADASNEAAFRHFRRVVKIGYDPSEGLLKLEVIAPDAALGVRASQALVDYASEQVDAQTQDMRRDRMAGAQESLEDAEAKMREAQARVLSLQEERGVLSADAEVQSLMGQISTFEVELKKEQLALDSLLDNERPNQTKVEVARRNIARLEGLIADMRSEMTDDSSGSASLARVTGELVVAQAELETRHAMMAQALQALETARVDANSQASYLIQDVRPTLSDEPSYPKVFENTLLAFLFFSGVYLMISLTASILREQVSS